MNAALKKQGWKILEPIAQDASSRRYTRVGKNGMTAILMEMGHESAELPAYIRIAGWINETGLRAPEIYEADEGAGYALVEDFGDLTFSTALARGHDPEDLYRLAADVLENLRASPGLLPLPPYRESVIDRGRRRLVDWYVPVLLGRRNPDGLAESYIHAWSEIEAALPPCAQGFVHADFHLGNLMLLENGQKGVLRCGILDFQGALLGPVAYDLGNLLEDARTDVPGIIRADILSRCDPGFFAWYRVLATQFHCRVIGQFIKLALEGGRPQYLLHLPRLAAYISAALEDPVLAPLARWFNENGIRPGPVGDPESARRFIRSDAF